MAINRSITSDILIFFICLLGYWQPAHAQEIAIDYSEEMVIEEEKDEFFIGNLYGVEVDNEGSIYLFDSMDPKVIKLDSQGSYLEQIIRSGRGPGEIAGMDSYYLHQDREEILIASRNNARLAITDLEGSEQGIIPMHPQDMNTPRDITHYQKDQYLFLFSLGENQSLRQEENIDAFFHVYDIANEERLYSFGDRQITLEQLQFESEAAKQTTTFNVGEALFHGEKLIYAPHVYNGRLLLFQAEGNQSWNLETIVKGKDWDRPAAEDLIVLEDASFEKFESEEDKLGDTGRNRFRFFSQDMKIVALLNNRTAGLFRLDDYFIHFTVTEHEADDTFYHKLHAEVFDESWNYIGADVVREGEEQQIFWSVDAVDKDGYFYMNIRSGETGLSKAIKFSLDIQKE